MYISDITHGGGWNRCRIRLEEGEAYDEEKLYKACDGYYTPHLGGAIQPYGKNIFNVTVYTD